MAADRQEIHYQNGKSIRQKQVSSSKCVVHASKANHLIKMDHLQKQVCMSVTVSVSCQVQHLWKTKSKGLNMFLLGQISREVIPNVMSNEDSHGGHLENYNSVQIKTLNKDFGCSQTGRMHHSYSTSLVCLAILFECAGKQTNVNIPKTYNNAMYYYFL